MRAILLLSSLFFMISCAEKERSLTAQNIVDKAIEIACDGKCDHVMIDFTFRDRCYMSTRRGGEYRYERITSNITGVTHDILTNTAFSRYKNDTLVKVADSMAIKYSNSINSVFYFALLPFGLNAPAAQKELLGEAIVKGEPYYEIGVSYKEEGGGTDHEDLFVYWIHKNNFTMDYLAYEYAVDGGGIRFREANNPRIVNGIRFADYLNYKPDNLEVSLKDLDEFFEKGKLELLSKIDNESVGVRILESN